VEAENVAEAGPPLEDAFRVADQQPVGQYVLSEFVLHRDNCSVVALSSGVKGNLPGDQCSQAFAVFPELDRRAVASVQNGEREIASLFVLAVPHQARSADIGCDTPSFAAYGCCKSNHPVKIASAERSLVQKNLYQFVDFLLIGRRGSAVAATGTSGAAASSAEPRDGRQKQRAAKYKNAQKKYKFLSHYRHILSVLDHCLGSKSSSFFASAASIVFRAESCSFAP